MDEPRTQPGRQERDSEPVSHFPPAPIPISREEKRVEDVAASFL